MSGATLYWHDYETSGINPARDRPLQFAGVRTDEELNIVGDPLMLYCQPSRDILPSPLACLITGITPQKAAAKGIPEREFIARIHSELSQPNTCGVGYNSIRFDDEVTRYTLYRNFYDPYEREWRNGNSRWDILDMMRLARALRPEGIEWPDNDDGFPSFKLENLTAANGLDHSAAHDALSDVMATISLARLVRKKQPRLYRYLYEHRKKQKVSGLINLIEPKPFLHVSSRLPRENGYVALMMPLAQHPTNKNAVLSFNLLGDADSLIRLSAEEIRERVFTATEALPAGIERLPLKAVHLNKAPVVATPALLDEAAAKRLGIDLQRCEEIWQKLQQHNLGQKVAAVFSGQQFETAIDAELRLYDGFLPNTDKPLLEQVRSVSPEGLKALHFEDKRYQELLFNYRARNFPHTLSEEEQHRWEEFRFQRLTNPGLGFLTQDQYFEDINSRLAEEQLTHPERDILRQLLQWGDEIL